MKKLLPVALLSLLAVSSFAGYETPEATIAALAAATAKDGVLKPSAFLPDSYQRDLVGIMNLFGRKMDADVWNSIADLAATAGTSLAPKADFLVSSDVSQADRAQKTTEMAAGLKALADFAKSDDARIENLRTATSTSVLDGLFAALTPILGTGIDAKPENFRIVQSQKLDNGDVRLTFATDAIASAFGDVTVNPKAVDFRQVEGCWLPSSLVTDWTEDMDKARAALESLDFTSAQGQQLKNQLVMHAPSLKMGVQNMGMAQNREAFQQSAQMTLLPVLMMLGNSGITLPGF